MTRTAKLLQRSDQWVVIQDNPHNAEVQVPVHQVRLIEMADQKGSERLDELWHYRLTGEPTEAMKRAREKSRPAAEERLRAAEAGSIRRDDELQQHITLNMVCPFPDLLAQYETYLKTRAVGGGERPGRDRCRCDGRCGPARC